MAIKFDWISYLLEFKKPAGTSRGVLKDKQSWFIKLYDESAPSIYGLGEISLLPGLSLDFGIDVEHELERLKPLISKSTIPSDEHELQAWIKSHIPNQMPSLIFAMETAFLDLMNGGVRKIFNTDFYNTNVPLPINGLIWMGNHDEMQQELNEKISAGFSCIKIKVGAIDFEEECLLLNEVRKNYTASEITLRLDANGAFLTNEVLIKLKKLAAFDIHSIEQPIRPNQPEAMSLICDKSQIPIALDEELIGIHGYDRKSYLLNDLKPQYIVLKPSLIGGMAGAKEWIKIAEDMGIGWWITSALESNIGLNAICQFVSQYKSDLPQGLGTGQLYTNNIPSPLHVSKGSIHYQSKGHWDNSVLEF